MTRMPPIHLLSILAVCLLFALLGAPLAAEEPLTTQATLLIGFPDENAPEAGVLIVPGTVIPLRDSSTSKGTLEAEEARSLHLVKMANDLRDSLRLQSVEIKYQLGLDLEIDVERSLPAPAAKSDVRLQVELLGYNDVSATYAVQFFERSAIVADTKVTAVRGESAVVGGRDGDEAPYLFLVLEPASAKADKIHGPIRVSGDVTPPRATNKTMPAYPEAARKERIEGVVIVQVVIDEEGRISDAEVLKGLSHGLSESAVESVKNWRFEPALLDGEPVAVRYNLTINFRLDPDQKE